MYCHYIGLCIVLYTEVSFIQSVLYQRFHCIHYSGRTAMQWPQPRGLGGIQRYSTTEATEKTVLHVH